MAMKSLTYIPHIKQVKSNSSVVFIEHINTGGRPTVKMWHTCKYSELRPSLIDCVFLGHNNVLFLRKPYQDAIISEIIKFYDAKRKDYEKLNDIS